jgi:hypothetical protein
MSEKSLAQKLLVKPGKTLRFINAPVGFSTIFGDLPQGVALILSHEKTDVVLFFVKNMSELQPGLPEALEAVIPGGILWLVYPKLTSNLAADINRDIIWRYLGTIGYTGVAMVSVDDTWSAFRVKRL